MTTTDDDVGAGVEQRTRMRRRELLIAGFWIAALVATVPNTIEAFTDVEGAWWGPTRLALSVVATCALIALIADWLVERRRNSGELRLSSAERDAPGERRGKHRL